MANNNMTSVASLPSSLGYKQRLVLAAKDPSEYST